MLFSRKSSSFTLPPSLGFFALQSLIMSVIADFPTILFILLLTSFLEYLGIFLISFCLMLLFFIPQHKSKATTKFQQKAKLVTINFFFPTFFSCRHSLAGKARCRHCNVSSPTGHRIGGCVGAVRVGLCCKISS